MFLLPILNFRYLSVGFPGIGDAGRWFAGGFCARQWPPLGSGTAVCGCSPSCSKRPEIFFPIVSQHLPETIPMLVFPIPMLVFASIGPVADSCVLNISEILSGDVSSGTGAAGRGPVKPSSDTVFTSCPLARSTSATARKTASSRRAELGEKRSERAMPRIFILSAECSGNVRPSRCRPHGPRPVSC